MLITHDNNEIFAQESFVSFSFTYLRTKILKWQRNEKIMKTIYLH